MNLVLSVNALPKELNTDKTGDYVVLKSLNELKTHIENTPRSYDTIYVDDLTISFNSISLKALKAQFESGFISFEKLVYITTRSQQEVGIVFNNIFKGYNFEIISVQIINSGIITSAINGEIVQTAEKKYSVIHKTKLDDYIKQNGSNVVKHTKPIVPDIIKNVPLKEVELVKNKILINIVNFDNYSTSVFLSMIYNNLRVNNKVFTMEFDRYNYFSDYEVRLGIKEYCTDIDEIKDNNSCLFLHKDYTETSYNVLFNFIYNITNFDYYLKVLDNTKVYDIPSNTFIPIDPTVDNIIKLASLISKYKPKHVDIILIYKGFIDMNELKPSEVRDTLKSISDFDFDLNSYIVKDKDEVYDNSDEEKARA